MGTLYIVSTPIGNLEDITIRAIKTLFSVEVIACEDTRRTGLLLQELKKRYAWVFPNLPATAKSRHGVSLSTRLISYYDQTEQQRMPEILEILEQNKDVALVSDAGTPLISDPGFLLVREARKRGTPVVSIPGPAALIAALTSSGLPADKFFFLGYPPEKQSARLNLFSFLLRRIDTSKYSPTIIFYNAPHKLQQTLSDMQRVFGDIHISVARELTKVHEQVWSGPVSEAKAYFANPKGEIVLLFRLD